MEHEFMRLRFGGGLRLTGAQTACLTLVLSLLVTNIVLAADDEAPSSGSPEQTRSDPSETKDQPQTERYSIGEILFGSDDVAEAQSEDDARTGSEGEPAIPTDPAEATHADDGKETPEVESAGEQPVLGDALRELMEINPIVARVDGSDIRWAEVVWSSGDLPLEDEEQIESLFPALLDRLIDLKLLAAAARRAGLDKAEDIKLQVAIYEANLIRERLLSNHLKQVVNEETVRRRYEDLVRATDSSHQIRARHILLSSEEEARNVIERLDAGSDFAALARSRSTGPSAPRGGDLGYFDPSRMVPEFARAALELEVGAYSAEPVRTAFGWHVIQLLDHRMEGVPDYEEMRASITEQLRQEAAQNYLRELRGAAAVEYFPEALDADGETNEPADAPDSQD
jgi:peptidyl-prolyl cis-trans isomerase C